MFGGKSKTKELRKRYIELAGMLKEKSVGSMIDLDLIKSRFSLQEGIRLNRAQEYLEVFEGAGLIIYTSGNKCWKYNADAEWELFKINI